MEKTQRLLIIKDNDSKTVCSYFIEETYLGLELARPSHQSILQEGSHTIDLQSIQTDKYKKVML